MTTKLKQGLDVEGNVNVQGSLTGVPASDITYDNTTSGLTANETQAAIDEIVASSGSSVDTQAVVVSGVGTMDLSAANLFTVDGASAGTFNLLPTNVPAAPAVASFILQVDAGTSSTITFWGTSAQIFWVDGSEPVFGTGRDVIGFYTYDGGNIWTGIVMGQNLISTGGV